MSTGADTIEIQNSSSLAWAESVGSRGSTESLDRSVPVFDEDSAVLTASVAGIDVHVTFETTLGLLAAFFIGFFAPVVFAVLTLVGMAAGRFDMVMGSLPLLLSSGWLAILIAKMAAEASMGRFYDSDDAAPRIDTSLPRLRIPFALAMAARMPDFSWFWRPVISVWWISHFCVAAAIGHYVAVGVIKRLDVATILIAIPLAVVVHFAFLFASNLYLVLAARALVRSPRFCIRVWKWRYLIDFVIALLMLSRGLK